MQIQGTTLLILCFFLAIIGTTSTRCTYDNEIDLYGSGNCDTLAVKYSATIAPIIQQNCASCHSPTATATNKPMDTYATLKKYVEDGSLGHSIRATGGYDIMPQSGPLNNCQLQQIEAWIHAGYPDN